MNLPRLLRSALLFTVLALPLSAYEGWMTDIAAAKAKAKAEGKQLVLEFTGSTWCPPCKALHAEVLTSAEFAAFAADKVLALVDYPRAKDRTPEKIAADPELARIIALKDEYNVPGFPTMFVFDAKGQELAKVVGYEKGAGPASYIGELTKK